MHAPSPSWPATRSARAPWRAAVTDVAWLLAIAASVAVLAGLGSWAFLTLLERVTRTRASHRWLIGLLPLLGVLLGVVRARTSAGAWGGTNLVLDELAAHESVVDATPAPPVARGVPLLMAPIVGVGTLLAHLCGASDGREGAAVQIAAGLGDGIVGRLTVARARTTAAVLAARREVVLVAAIAGGFASVFGVPLAGAVFALELPRRARGELRRLPYALVASAVGDRVARGLGVRHGDARAFPAISVDVRWAARLCVLGLAFGLAARTYVVATRLVRRRLAVWVPVVPLRMAAGGASVLALHLLSGTRAYEGMSLPLIAQAVHGGRVAAAAWALKLLATALTIGAGFPGGEVTPLFCVGATLGSVLAGPLGAGRPVAAMLGYVAVFGAASNTPLTCTIVAGELFGAPALLPAALVCVLASAVSGHPSVYESQR